MFVNLDDLLISFTYDWGLVFDQSFLGADTLRIRFYWEGRVESGGIVLVGVIVGICRLKVVGVNDGIGSLG